MYSNPSDGLSWLITQYSHPLIMISQAWHDESTSNLARHVRNCASADSTQTCALTASASGSKYTKPSHRMKIALWLSNHHHPFSIIEDTKLLEIFTDLHPNCKTPKHHTISHDVKEMFFLSLKWWAMGMMLQVGHVTLHCSTIFLPHTCLQKYPGRLHTAADGWTSPNVIAFIGVTVHWARSHQLFLTSLSKFSFFSVVGH